MIMRDYNEFKDKSFDFFQTIEFFKHYGIDMSSNIGLIRYNWHNSESLSKKVAKLEWFNTLGLTEMVALALAVWQEENNSHISLDDLDKINRFFCTSINRNVITVISSRFGL